MNILEIELRDQDKGEQLKHIIGAKEHPKNSLFLGL